MKKTISIVITTFNSEKTLPLVLKSIKKQTFFHNQIEVIVVDGGSTDKTISIVKKNNLSTIYNPRTEQNYGKLLGYLHAKGKYVMFLDSDEILENKNSLKIKINTFITNPNVKIVIGCGYKNPPGYPFINKYINEFGDPFSFFIYRISKNSDFFINSMKKKYPVKHETENYILFDLFGAEILPIIELTAGSCMVDAKFLKEKFPETKKKIGLLNHSFYLIHSVSPILAITKNDCVIHFSSNSTRRYLNKISWRVKNNIYHVSTMGMSGFIGRDKFQSGNMLSLKKYLFVPYSYSIIFPLIDSIHLSITRRDAGYLLHFPLCVYTASLIIYHSLLRAIGVKPQLQSYGENKLINEVNLQSK